MDKCSTCENDKCAMKTGENLAPGQTIQCNYVCGVGLSTTVIIENKRCCDGCNKTETCKGDKVLWLKGWDTSRDFCSKWEEKKEELHPKALLIEEILKDPRISGDTNVASVIDVLEGRINFGIDGESWFTKDHFRNRVQESLDTLPLRGLNDNQWAELYKGFAWLLGEDK